MSYHDIVLFHSTSLAGGGRRPQGPAPPRAAEARTNDSNDNNDNNNKNSINDNINIDN